MLLTGSFLWLGVAPAKIVSSGSQFTLPTAADASVDVPRSIDEGTLAQAIYAEPLNQTIFNAAMVSAVARNPALDLKPWLNVLSGLGWRDTRSLQNVIAEAVRNEDIGSLVNAADALLRMKEIEPEATQMMNLAEAYPETWPGVFKLLKENVVWRDDYLARAATMTAPAVLDGRAKTMSALQAAGVQLKPRDVKPFVVALTTAGRYEQADRLWRNYTGDRSNAVHDPHFLQALAAGPQPEMPLTFGWSLNSDIGYSADVASNGLGGATVMLQWDGRGLPVFLSQQISTGPGRHLLQVRVDGDTQAFGERIGFRLRCGETLTPFEPVRQPGRADLILATQSAVPCIFPTLEAYGRIQKSVRAFEGALSTISMARRTEDPAALGRPQ